LHASPIATHIGQNTPFLSVLVIVGSLFGCADSQQVVRFGNAVEPVRMAAGDSIYIAVPRDGVYGVRTYQGSGLITSRILFGSFSKRARRVEVALSYQSFGDSLQFARKSEFKYLVYPTILHWEDRATEWSALPDRVEVKIDLIETAMGKLLDSVVIRGKSGLATLGGDHPQDLLPKPVDEFVSSLFHPA
jgi:Domain of unknown function (DUF4823)